MNEDALEEFFIDVGRACNRIKDDNACPWNDSCISEIFCRKAIEETLKDEEE